MAANDLERIYLLKSVGVDGVLRDINSITAAFEQSAKAKAELSKGGTLGFDSATLKSINDRMEELVAYQEQLLDHLKGTNAEFSKSATNVRNYSQATKVASDGTNALSTSATKLGGNLTEVSAGLLKVQNTLNKGALEDYDGALRTLADQYIILTENLDRIKLQFAALNNQMIAGDLNSEEYEARQTELTAQLYQTGAAIGEVVQGMNLLNKTYNPQISAEATLGIKQEAEARKLEAAATQEAIDKQAELNEIKTGIKSGVRNKQLANQYGVGGIEGEAARKQEMEDRRRQIELSKNGAIAASEESSYYYRLAASLNVARIQFRLLATEEEVYGEKGQALIATIAKLDTEIKALDRSIGNNQRSIGDYALGFKGLEGVINTFSRQFVRGIGSLIIWQVLFDGISKVYDLLSSSIPGTEAYVEAQEQVKQELDALSRAFDGLSDAMIKEAKVAKDNADINIANEEAYQAVLDNTVDGAKRKQAAIEANGVTDRNQYEAEQKQLQATLELREQELDALNKKRDTLDDLNSLLIKMGGEDKDQILALITMSNLPLQKKIDLKKQIEEAMDQGFTANEAIEVARRANISAISDVAQEQKTKQQEADNAQAAFDAKVYNRYTDAKLNVYNQLNELDAQYRQLKEKLDIESIDKIVHTTAEKYEQLNAKVRQQAVEAAKGMTDVLIVKNKAGFEDFDAEFAALPDNIKAIFAPILSINKGMQKQEDINKIFEYSKQKLLSDESFAASNQSTLAGISMFNAGYGKADYSKMTKALDEQTQAKVEAAKNEALALSLQYQGDADKQADIEKAKNAKIQQIEKEAYAQRLQLASEFFKRITENADAANANLITQLDIATQISINKVLRRRVAGNISEGKADKLIDKISNRGIMKEAETNIKHLGDVDLPKAKAATEEASTNRDAAQVEADQTVGTDKHAEAVDRLTLAIAAYNKALADQLLIEGKITKAEHDRLIAATKLKAKDYTKEIANGLLDIAQTFSNSYMELLAKEDAYRHEMAQRSLAWNQKVMESEVQSANQRFTQERATVIAQQQLDRDKAIADRKRAEQSIALNAVIASGKALALDLPEDPIKFAIDEGVILAQTAIQEAMLAKAPAYATGTGSHPGGFAWVGDGYEHELVRIGKSMFMTPNTPTLVNMPHGAEVTPMSKIGVLGSNVKAPSFYASNTAQANHSADIDAHEAAIHHIYGMIGSMAKSVANINVEYNPRAANKAALKASYRHNII